MEMKEAIKQAGVVGAGGAGFPTHVKLNVQAERVIINGAECEPLLRGDQLLMEHYAAQMVRGLELAMRAAQAPRGVIATKTHYEAAVEALGREIKNKPHIALHLMESYYPSGDEKSVIFEVTGKVVPTGKLPIDEGCVVINVGTAINIAAAVDGLAVIEKLVTVGGDVPVPVTVSVPIGVTIQEVLRLSGFTGTPESHAIIVGGPCMGSIAADWSEPITKTTGGLLALKNTHPLVMRDRLTVEQQARLARSICCQCNRCTQLCPRHAMGLPVEPHKAMRAISTGNATLLGNAAGVLACSSCGLCTNFACEMGLTPSAVMTMLKQELGKAGVRPVPETEIKPEPEITLKNIPVKRLIARMALTQYDVPAPLSKETVAPSRVTLLLKQHVGKPATANIQVGDRVTKGQLIADVEPGALGAAIHASITGTVIEISDRAIVLAVQ